MTHNKRKIFCLGLGLGILLTGLFSFTFDNNLLPFKQENDRIQYQWYPPKLPAHLSFAGENVPLNQEPVREKMEKELISNTYSHSHILYILKLSNRIFPQIEKVLKENGIPEDFKYMCVAESSLEHPTSPAGAEGYWQFMDATARHYGLEVDREVDERYDLIKSTQAACVYLKNAYSRFGSWTAAAASYNCGMAGYESRADFQMTNDYYKLDLPEETENYLFRILALKAVISHPARYGFHIPPSEYYHKLSVKTITVTESIPNLAVFAKQHGTTFKMLRYLNPWLRSRSLTISEGNSYAIKLPKK